MYNSIMNKITSIILSLIIGILVGGSVVMAYKSGEKNNTGIMNHDMSQMENEMNGMMAELEGKTGDEFDKAFLSEMIMHHQGAVLMAEAALKNAKHQEIKSLAKAIISAQNKEIVDMKVWLKNWYGIEHSENSAEGAPVGSIHNLPVPEGVDAARKQLAQNLKIEENKVVIITAYERDWSDSCLGLGGPAESCAAVITPGYEVTLQAQGKTYVYHTNTEGTITREKK